jgi:hypothetical protein
MGHNVSLIVLDGVSDLYKTEGVVPRVVFRLVRDYAFFGQFTDMSYRRPDEPDIPEQPIVQTHPIPPTLWLEMGDDGRKKLAEGTWTYADEMKKLDARKTYDFNRAAKAYIDELPYDIPILICSD